MAAARRGALEPVRAVAVADLARCLCLRPEADQAQLLDRASLVVWLRRTRMRMGSCCEGFQ